MLPTALLKVTEDSVDLGPIDESAQTELTSIGIEDIKDYAQYYGGKCATLSTEILGLLIQHYQKSGEPIRLLIHADHVVKIALPKRTLESCYLRNSKGL